MGSVNSQAPKRDEGKERFLFRRAHLFPLA